MGCLLIKGNFGTVKKYAEKAELIKGSCCPKRKLGITVYFSEIVKLQFEKKIPPYIALYFIAI